MMANKSFHSINLKEHSNRPTLECIHIQSSCPAVTGASATRSFSLPRKALALARRFRPGDFCPQPQCSGSADLVWYAIKVWPRSARPLLGFKPFLVMQSSASDQWTATGADHGWPDRVYEILMGLGVRLRIGFTWQPKRHQTAAGVVWDPERARLSGLSSGKVQSCRFVFVNPLWGFLGHSMRAFGYSVIVNKTP